MNSTSTDAVRIRLATPDDVPGIARLAAQLVRFHHCLDPVRVSLVERSEDGYE